MPTPLDEHPALKRIVELLQSKKGVDILLMDLRSISDAADFFVLCTGSSELHIQTLCKELVDRLRQEGQRPWHVEGLETRRWVLIDFVDIVVHLFDQEARSFYALERLWGDAESLRIEESETRDSRILV